MRKKLWLSAAMGAAMIFTVTGLVGCNNNNTPPNEVVYQSAPMGKFDGEHCHVMRANCCTLIKKYGCKGMDMDGCRRIARSHCKGALAMSGCERMLNSCAVKLPCCMKKMSAAEKAE